MSEVSWVLKIVRGSQNKYHHPCSPPMGRGCVGLRGGVNGSLLWRFCFSKVRITWSCYVVGKNRKLFHWSLSLLTLILLLNILQASLRISEWTATTKSTGSLRLETGGKIKAVVGFCFSLQVGKKVVGKGSWGQGDRPWKHSSVS